MNAYISICFPWLTPRHDKAKQQLFTRLHPPPPLRKCSCLSLCHFLRFRLWQMTVFISKEGHIFQKCCVWFCRETHYIWWTAGEGTGEWQALYFQKKTEAFQRRDNGRNSTSCRHYLSVGRARVVAAWRGQSRWIKVNHRRRFKGGRNLQTFTNLKGNLKLMFEEKWDALKFYQKLIWTQSAFLK